MRGLKISENQSPRPQDRVFFTFDYFSNVNGPLNQRLGAPVRDIRVYRYIFGWEQTFDDGNASIGVRLPLDQLTSGPGHPRPLQAGRRHEHRRWTTWTSIVKYILRQDPKTGQPGLGRAWPSRRRPGEQLRRGQVHPVHQHDALPAVRRLHLESRQVLSPGLLGVRVPGQPDPGHRDVQRHRHGLLPETDERPYRVPDRRGADVRGPRQQPAQPPRLRQPQRPATPSRPA